MKDPLSYLDSPDWHREVDEAYKSFWSKPHRAVPRKTTAPPWVSNEHIMTEEELLDLRPLKGIRIQFGRNAGGQPRLAGTTKEDRP